MMNRFSSALCGVAAVSVIALSTLTPAHATAPDKTATVLFKDTFTGAAGTLPDPTKWGYDIGRWGDGLTYFTNSNATLDGAGHLAVRVKQETPPDGDSLRPFTGTRMTTKNKAEFTPNVKIKVTAKLPAAGTGMWPALWLLGNNPADQNNWPEEGEIDLMESRTRHPAYTDPAHPAQFLFQTLHGPGNTPATAHTDKPLGYSGRWNSVPPIPNLSDSYHVFTMVWKTDRVVFQISNRDGDKTPHTTFTVTRTSFEANGGDWDVFAGNWAYYLIFSNSADAAFKPQSDPSGAPLLIDSVVVTTLSAKDAS